MIWTDGEGSVSIKNNVQQTINKPIIKEIVVDQGGMRSVHPFNTELLNYFINMLEGGKVEITDEL